MRIIEIFWSQRVKVRPSFNGIKGCSQSSIPSSQYSILLSTQSSVLPNPWSSILNCQSSILKEDSLITTDLWGCPQIIGMWLTLCRKNLKISTLKIKFWIKLGLEDSLQHVSAWVWGCLKNVKSGWWRNSVSFAVFGANEPEEEWHCLGVIMLESL